jgi:hypothetical protein
LEKRGLRGGRGVLEGGGVHPGDCSWADVAVVGVAAEKVWQRRGRKKEKVRE